MKLAEQPGMSFSELLDLKMTSRKRRFEPKMARRHMSPFFVKLIRRFLSKTQKNVELI